MNTEAYDNYAAYLRNQRRRYAKGLPSSHRPEDMVYWERNPEDLAWFNEPEIDFTASALEWVNKELFPWMDSHEGKAPSTTSKDPVEKVLGGRLSHLRQNKKNNKDGWTTYGSELLGLAKQHGYHDVFNRICRASEALERTEELFDWMDANEGKAPSTTSKDSVEKALGSRVSTMRKSKKNNSKGWPIYGTKVDKLATERDYPSVFDTTNRTHEALEWAEELFDWMGSHEGKTPSQKSKDFVEKVLGIKLSKMRQIKKNNKEGWPLYGSELLKLAKQRGYPRVFNTGGSR